MLNIFIGFVTFYLSFLLLIFVINYLLGITWREWQLSYNKTLQIVNVAFAVAILLFIMATLFIIPLQQTDETKQSWLIAIFSLSYLGTVAFSFYDQHKNSLKNKVNENVDEQESVEKKED